MEKGECKEERKKSCHKGNPGLSYTVDWIGQPASDCHEGKEFFFSSFVCPWILKSFAHLCPVEHLVDGTPGFFSQNAFQCLFFVLLRYKSFYHG